MKLLPKNKIWLRTVLQVFFLVLIALIAVNHVLEESGEAIPLLSNASLHAICPFGAVVSLYQFATVGTFTQKIHQSSFILMALVFVLTLLFGAVFCGWMCPLGSVQEWVGKLGKRLFKKRYNHFFPPRIDKYLRYLRYIMLIWVLYATAMTGKLAFGDIDPYDALFISGPEKCYHWLGGVGDHTLGLFGGGTALVQVCLSLWRPAGDHQPVQRFLHPAAGIDVHIVQSMHTSLPHEHSGPRGRGGAGSPVYWLPGMHFRGDLSD